MMTEPEHGVRPQPDAQAESPTPGGSPAVRAPTGYDPDWRARIETARQARDQARKARGDGPVVFRHPRLPL